jgi:enoyl-[acyl-carrier protein] reductase III
VNAEGSATGVRERWALILGASSGFGEATAVALAEAGYRIVGVHLDFRAALAHVEDIKARIAAAGSEALYLNMNAADDDKRAWAIEQIGARFDDRRRGGADPYLRVVVHSLAFGTLLPFVADDSRSAVNRKQMEMTLDVMANSLVYWVQDLLRAGLVARGTHVYAMTSEGSSRVIPTYGAVSAAKAALESHCRQLASELARAGTGITVNAIRAGVTITPALMKIPEHDLIIEAGERRNPSGRLTTPEDVASAIVRLSEDGLDWVTGNTIGVDGGEFVSG